MNKQKQFGTTRILPQKLTKTVTLRRKVEEGLYVRFINLEEKPENNVIYVKGIQPKTTILSLKTSENIQTNGTIEILKEGNKIKEENTVIGTGYLLRITKSESLLDNKN